MLLLLFTRSARFSLSKHSLSSQNVLRTQKAPTHKKKTHTQKQSAPHTQKLQRGFNGYKSSSSVFALPYRARARKHFIVRSGAQLSFAHLTFQNTNSTQVMVAASLGVVACVAANEKICLFQRNDCSTHTYYMIRIYCGFLFMTNYRVTRCAVFCIYNIRGALSIHICSG